MTKNDALHLALEVLQELEDTNSYWWQEVDEVTTKKIDPAITAIKAALEAKDEPWEQFYPEMGKPYAFEASIYSNARMKVDVVTGNVSIGTVKKPCGLECDCTDVCKQDDYKALWQQMCERCDELDKKLAQRKPLTDEEVWDAYMKAPVDINCHVSDLHAFARAIEAAHGITGENNG